MKKNLPRFLQPNNRLFIFFLIVFAAATYFIPDHYLVSYIEIGIIVALIIYSLIADKIRKDKMLKYIEEVTYSVDSATRNTLMSFPMPMVIFSLLDNEIAWANDLFNNLSGGKAHAYATRMSDIIPNFYGKWLSEGKNVCPELVVLNDRKYYVFGHVARTSDNSSKKDVLGTTYWIDVTDYDNIRHEYYQSRPVVALALIDNYDDLLKNCKETVRAAVQGSVEDAINSWLDQTGALVRRFDRDSYIIIFEERYLDRIINEKFTILDKVHEILSSNGNHATISLGIGKGGASFIENSDFASLAVDMALSRGGDQAVVKNPYSFDFYGGHATETEKHTKVKSRVMASSLSSLIDNASNVYIMGHKLSDLDCIGAAVGISCIVRKCGKKAKIVVDKDCPAQDFIERMSSVKEYKGIFISAQDALVGMDNKSLLVVVDTNRPDQVISEELLTCGANVVVIDHHRRAAEYIQNAVLSYHEPYASSASELVSELLQYICNADEILKSEAEALLAGIVLDTKSFSLRTGSRTFDAAGFLKRMGADTTEVKKFLQNDLTQTVEKYNIIRSAKLYKQGIAIAASDTETNRILAAQAADELLNIAGISASFVLFEMNGTVNISARSIGDINVQLILEKLGGGGNKSTAGAQIKDSTLQDTGNNLLKAIDQYLGEENIGGIL